MRQTLVVTLSVVLIVAVGLAAGPAVDPASGQTTPPATDTEPTTSSVPPSGATEAPSSDPSPLPPIGEDQSGSPAVFVVLSLVGAAVALAIMAVTWIRTRPD